MREAVRASALAALLLAAAGASAAAAVPTGEPVAGIRCDAAEGVALHVHVHLAIFDHGRAVPIPDDVGRPLAGDCVYWLHTHTADGILHVESPRVRTFTLGEFFAVWGRPLTPRDVAGATLRPGERLRVFVDGKLQRTDPRGIALRAHRDIVILVGPPYAQPAPFTAWNGNS